ncbi:InlB B-repeat-containing protein [Bifidobacterium biavatii]|uniref:Glycoside hydrolase, family 25 n=1 Tax=Bifidobacterium biavatii DSM 23969 TaxID=1437608 RepID=A0A086ZN31_9BIFI|nr:InlB B-repeat-containing protein [Bifidobacterium biavatii]KFI47931.1 Glycoside hydrolase, family 25 [Bifidobacterium biavatii DSM 23969]
MTGNAKVWRAPLAGLASVAMIATMGVTAFTATAADVTFTFNVDGTNLKFDKDKAPANVTVKSEKQVTVKDLDGNGIISEAETTAVDSALSYDSATFKFTGWYDSNNNAVAAVGGNESAVRTGDSKATTVDAHYGRGNDYYIVAFQYGADTVAKESYWYVLKGDKLAQWQVPSEGNTGDGQILTSWKGDDNSTVDPTSDLSDLRLNDTNWVNLHAQYADSAAVTFSTTDFWKEGRTIKVNGENASKTVEVVKGAKFGQTVPSATFEKGGKKWVAAGFATEAEAKKAADKRTLFSKDTVVNTDTVLYAVTPSEYFTVTFDLNGGEGEAPKAQDVLKDGTATKPADPTKKASATNKYAFTGWTTDAAGKKAFNFSSKITDDIILYAQYKVSEVKVTFDPNYGKEPVVEKWFKDGDEFAFPTVNRDGYVLSWGDNTANLDGKKLSIEQHVDQDTGELIGKLTYLVSAGEGTDTDYILPSYVAEWTAADAETLTKLEGKVSTKLDKDQDWYTAASYKQYKADFESYLAKKAEFEKSGSGYTVKEYAELIKLLADAQAKLVETGNVALYRVYNPNNGDHYFTTNRKEATRLVQLGWKAEGAPYKVAKARSNSVYTGTDEKGNPIYTKVSANFGTAVWSVYNPNTGEHLLTFESEANGLAKAGWTKEDIKFYTSQNGNAPVVRVYNPNTNGPAHLYTKASEARGLAKLGWKIDNSGKAVFTLTK